MLYPSATGVLLILLGEACKTFDVFRYEKKEYLARIKLGWKSSTWDSDGELEECPGSSIDISGIEEILKRMQGRYLHRVPEFSAKKYKGQTFYDMKRKGQTPPERFQETEIYSIEYKGCEQESVVIRVLCSSGTYIRTLAVDIAAALGTSGYLEELVRTGINGFTLEDSSVPEENRWTEGFIDINQALKSFPHIVISDSAASAVRFGRVFSAPDIKTEPDSINNAMFPVFSESGIICALSKKDETGYFLERVFNIEDK